MDITGMATKLFHSSIQFSFTKKICANLWELNYKKGIAFLYPEQFYTKRTQMLKESENIRES